MKDSWVESFKTGAIENLGDGARVSSPHLFKHPLICYRPLEDDVAL